MSLLCTKRNYESQIIKRERTTVVSQISLYDETVELEECLYKISYILESKFEYDCNILCKNDEEEYQSDYVLHHSCHNEEPNGVFYIYTAHMEIG